MRNNRQAAGMLDAVTALAPSLAARAIEIETARTLPADLVETLREIGFYRMFVSRDHGGMEIDIPTSLPIYEALAAADASAAWTVMTGGHAPIFTSLMPRASLDRIYANGPDVAWANSLVPAGRAEMVKGGYRVSGDWPLASGCLHADWIFGLCVVTEGGRALPGPSAAAPLMRCIALPAADWTVVDTWRAIGLEGSGSHTVTLSDAFAPADQSFDHASGVSELAGPLYRAPLAVLPVHAAAIAIGVAEGAVDDIIALASTGKRAAGAASDLRDSPVFHHALGRAEADLRAARALVHAQAAQQWRWADSGHLDADSGIACGQASAWAAAACIRTVETCYAAAGGSAVYDTSPLQRRLRDIRALAQHKAVNESNFTDAGAALCLHGAGALSA